MNEICRTRLASSPAEETAEGHPWVTNLRKSFPVEPIAIVLFGSEARGQATETSDVDLLVVFPEGTPITRGLYSKVEEIEPRPAAGREINPHLVALPASPDDAGSLWFEVALEGQTLWAADDRVAQFLRAVREAIAVGRVRKSTTHGHAYWIHEERHP